MTPAGYMQRGFAVQQRSGTWNLQPGNPRAPLFSLLQGGQENEEDPPGA